MTIVSNRRGKPAEALLSHSMKPYEYIVSHIIGRYIVLGTEFIAVMLGGWLIFSFHVEGSYLVYGVLAMLRPRPSHQLPWSAVLERAPFQRYRCHKHSIMPMMMLSGPSDNFPDWLQSIVRFFPLTALVDGLGMRLSP